MPQFLTCKAGMIKDLLCKVDMGITCDTLCEVLRLVTGM